MRYCCYNKSENAYPIATVKDNPGEYSFLQTECGNIKHSVCKDLMFRN